MQTATFPGSFSHDRSYGFMLAVVVHGALFLGGSLGLMQKADYGMDASNGVAEVDLVAAPAPMGVPTSVAASMAPAQTPAAVDPDDVAEPEKASTPPAPVPALQPVPNALLRTSNLNGPLGD